MKKWFAPLGIFVVGMLGLAIFFAVGRQAVTNATGNLSDNASELPGVAAGAYWGWDWLMTPGVVILIIVIIALLIIAYKVGKKMLGSG